MRKISTVFSGSLALLLLAVSPWVGQAWWHSAVLALPLFAIAVGVTTVALSCFLREGATTADFFAFLLASLYDAVFFTLCVLRE